MLVRSVAEMQGWVRKFAPGVESYRGTKLGDARTLLKEQFATYAQKQVDGTNGSISSWTGIALRAAQLCFATYSRDPETRGRLSSDPFQHRQGDRGTVYLLHPGTTSIERTPLPAPRTVEAPRPRAELLTSRRRRNLMKASRQDLRCSVPYSVHAA